MRGKSESRQQIGLSYRKWWAGDGGDGEDENEREGRNEANGKFGLSFSNEGGGGGGSDSGERMKLMANWSISPEVLRWVLGRGVVIAGRE